MIIMYKAYLLDNSLKSVDAVIEIVLFFRGQKMNVFTD